MWIWAVQCNVHELASQIKSVHDTVPLHEMHLIATKDGNPDAQLYLADAYHVIKWIFPIFKFSKHGLARNLTASFEFYEMLASQGNTTGQFMLGIFYSTGSHNGVIDQAKVPQQTCLTSRSVVAFTIFLLSCVNCWIRCYSCSILPPIIFLIISSLLKFCCGFAFLNTHQAHDRLPIRHENHWSSSLVSLLIIWIWCFSPNSTCQTPHVKLKYAKLKYANWYWLLH